MKYRLIFIQILFISIVLLAVKLNQEFLLKLILKRVLGQPYLPSSSAFKRYPASLSNYVFNLKKPLSPPIHCVAYSTMRREIPICIHTNNESITRSIIKTGAWEREHGDSIQTILHENPDYGLIDIGANLGMFSLLAANLKRPVLAVEAMDINIVKFHQSVVINRFEEYITLVTRPLSDKYETLKFIVSRSNLGKTMLIKNKAPRMAGALYYENKTTLKLDDLKDLMPRKKALIIIDVEGNEGKVLRGGLDFFDTIDITHVYMEWYHLTHAEQKYLLDFFATRNYKPYNSPKFTTKLDTSKLNRWGQNVFWKK